jgi:N-acetylmuramoyl-L-alanine amidase
MNHSNTEYDARRYKGLTPSERRRIAKRRAARRRRAYFFRTLFASILILLVIGIIKLFSLFFSGSEDETLLNGRNIEENIAQDNYKESLEASTYSHIVCIDPGHGYDDEGTSSKVVKGAIERDIVFDLAKRVKKILNKENIGVILSHNTNKTPSNYTGDQYLFGLDERVDYVNSLNIDFFVSIHCDFYDSDSSISGSRIYYLQDSSETLNDMAEIFSESIQSSMNYDKPLLMPMSASDAYYVLRYTDVPAVLIETGFLSNKTEAKEMLTDSWRDNMAEGIANGIISIFDQKYFN